MPFFMGYHFVFKKHNNIFILVINNDKQRRDKRMPQPQALSTSKRFTWYLEDMLSYMRNVIIIIHDNTCQQFQKRELLGNGSPCVAAKKDLENPISFGELAGQTVL